jgi:hypothetical protein
MVALAALAGICTPAQAADNLVCQGYADVSGFGYSNTERALVRAQAVIVDLDRQTVTYGVPEEHFPITNMKEVSAGGTLIDFGNTLASTYGLPTHKYFGSLDRITGGLSVGEIYDADGSDGANGAGRASYTLQCRRVTPLVGN